MQAEPPAVEAVDVSRTYTGTGAPVRGLDHVSMTVAKGEVVAVMGPSGSGKSTLLFLLGGLDQPDGGRIRVAGVDWTTLQGKERARFRRRACGFIVQGMALLSQATAAENVDVPLVLDGVPLDERRRRVAEALERVGLTLEADKLTDQLSGGQHQRVSIARALVNEPAVVLADEPTGSLDDAHARVILGELRGLVRERGTSVILVTHRAEAAAEADRALRLDAGRLEHA